MASISTSRMPHAGTQGGGVDCRLGLTVAPGADVVVAHRGGRGGALGPGGGRARADRPTRPPPRRASLAVMGTPSSRMRDFGTTIFAEMSALAAETGAVNLGQGFPDTDGPREMLEAAKAAIDEGRNQYPPGPGVPELLDAVAAHQWRFYGMDLDPARRSW